MKLNKDSSISLVVLEYKNRKTAIFGYSGHAYVVIDALLENEMSISGYFEQKQQKNNPYKLKYLGVENENTLKSLDTIVFPGVGSNSVRRKIITLFDKNDCEQIILQHPRSIISKTAKIEKSTFISAGAIVNSFAKIGKGCIINTGAIIEHECEIGNFSHIAPGSVLAGNVKIGVESFIGANSVIKQGITIGDNVTIGAGSVILKNVPNNEIWVGNPAKRLK